MVNGGFPEVEECDLALRVHNQYQIRTQLLRDLRTIMMSPQAIAETGVPDDWLCPDTITHLEVSWHASKTGYRTLPRPHLHIMTAFPAGKVDDHKVHFEKVLNWSLNRLAAATKRAKETLAGSHVFTELHFLSSNTRGRLP
jgi:hypothetical protein